ncbi:hypothetical protein [Serratia marcescens]|uniref:hypothetical protein n=1 Tax=Serratia marcescens TaxID=615 RepID=UPI0020213DDE|nr:hypothetical protein [Serratia marcescens]
MTIDWQHFTPDSALAGGAIIGAAGAVSYTDMTLPKKQTVKSSAGPRNIIKKNYYFVSLSLD